VRAAEFPRFGRRLRVLLMPEQFPAHSRDVAGVFSLDYIASIKRYCDVVVLMPARERHSGVARWRNDDVEYITYTPWIRNRRDFVQRLGRLESLYQLGSLGPSVGPVDLIHAHGPIFHGAAARRLGAALDVPVVLTVHTGPFSKLLGRPALRWLTRRTLEGVDCVCSVSDDLRHQIEAAGIKPKRMDVTYNPVDTDLFRPSPQANCLNQRITFAGRLEEYKGGLRVLRAFATIAKRWPEWTLTIAGDGPERPAIERFLQEHASLTKRVELIGSYTKDELAMLFATSSCFVYPSRHETFGLVLAEAMSAGLPVIGPDRTAPPEFIDARSGLLVPPDDVSAIASAMEQLLARLPSYRPNDIRQAMVERFGYVVFGQRLLSIYRDLSGGLQVESCAVSRA
jgi:glycosyltransferase involved in cell wall biosynthesis